MRRAWLLALVVLPAFASAQATPAAGQVTFDDAFINADECTSTSAANVKLSWDAGFVPTVQSGEYRVYASNEAHSTTCSTTSSGTKVVGEVVRAAGGTVLATTQTAGPIEYPATRFVTAAGLDCSQASQETIYVCVQVTSPGGASPFFGFMTGTLTLDVIRPTAVALDPPLAGDTALELSWGASAEADPRRYRLTAQSISDPSNVGSTSTADPRDPSAHVVTVTVTGYRLGDLVNDVTYKVVVSALDPAENLGDPSNVVTGTPKEVNDFWDLYHQRGREQGGCAGGPAGVASLAGAIAVLALLLRRRK